MKSIIVIEFDTVKMNPIYDEKDGNPTYDEKDGNPTRTDITKDVEKALHNAVFKHIEDLTVQNQDFAINTINHYSDDFHIHVDDVEDFSDYGEIMMKIYEAKDRNQGHRELIDKIVSDDIQKATK